MNVCVCVCVCVCTAVRDWSRASASDLYAIGLGSIPGGGQLRALNKHL